MPSPSYAAATTATTASSISGGTLLLIIMGAVLAFMFLYWVTQFGLMYFYYSLDPEDRPISIYDSQENNCNDLCCIYCNKSIIRYFCPNLLLKPGGPPSTFTKLPENSVGLITHQACGYLPAQKRLSCIAEAYEEDNDEELGLMSTPRATSSRFVMF